MTKTLSTCTFVRVIIIAGFGLNAELIFASKMPPLAFCATMVVVW